MLVFTPYIGIDTIVFTCSSTSREIPKLSLDDNEYWNIHFLTNTIDIFTVLKFEEKFLD